MILDGGNPPQEYGPGGWDCGIGCPGGGYCGISAFFWDVSEGVVVSQVGLKSVWYVYLVSAFEAGDTVADSYMNCLVGDRTQWYLREVNIS